ncbi:uncharacterized protein LOC126315221 [Schistocerca gregaria]|uniref:uncharacterized protein LOC126315221 n=1 Tax=Schistocerca gregaria TaxID=7010 RepID=UPI00211E68C9|nr:uncharacterized protein LOC126315221 [Schistocerca gregaria]
MSEGIPADGFQGIQKAEFIENVDEYIKSQDEAYEIIFNRLHQKFTSYKSLELRYTSQHNALQAKIPGIEKALEVLLYMKSNPAKKDIECDFELITGTYTTVSLNNTGTIFLWIGANLMVEYPINEALELLNSNKDNAEKAINSLKAGLKFLQEQIVIVQVSLARLHNWAVVNRQKLVANVK